MPQAAGNFRSSMNRSSANTSADSCAQSSAQYRSCIKNISLRTWRSEHDDQRHGGSITLHTDRHPRNVTRRLCSTSPAQLSARVAGDEFRRVRRYAGALFSAMEVSTLPREWQGKESCLSLWNRPLRSRVGTEDAINISR